MARRPALHVPPVMPVALLQAHLSFAVLALSLLPAPHLVPRVQEAPTALSQALRLVRHVPPDLIAQPHHQVRSLARVGTTALGPPPSARRVHQVGATFADSAISDQLNSLHLM